jgi:hypothetical protein
MMTDTKKFNTKILTKELEEIGIGNSGCNEDDGTVWDVDGITEIQNRSDVAALIAAHDPRDVDKERQDAYNRAGVTIEALAVALWEKLVENRPEAAEALQIKREQIKTKTEESEALAISSS